MKNLQSIAIIFWLFIGIGAQAQVQKPISWTAKVDKAQVAVGSTVDIIFSATIDGDWYLYSSDFDPNLGPTVTTFKFTPNSSYELVGGIKPVGAKKKYDPIWEGEYTYFKRKAEFRQTVRVLSERFNVVANVNYQVCTDVDGRCIPLEDDFAIGGGDVKVLPAANGAPVVQETAPTTAPTEITQPNEKAGEVVADSLPASVNNTTATQDASTISATVPAATTEESLAGFMIAAFLSGLLALLTPCVFPMIPMTVSFFIRKSQSRAQAVGKGIIFGLSIIGIYMLIGIIFSLIFGADAANLLATHWLPNVLFFLIFFVFALSFFGMFDIVLPASLTTKIDSQADRGGLAGIFFMALTLAVVSFSCTGPIVGTVLVEAAGGSLFKPALGMFAFSLAFALPFALFAIFPSLLSGLPKSGGWLNVVKVVLGFIELALAFKFLSVADQVYHWGLLDRPIFIAIWIAIALTAGMYLLGKVRLPHDSPVESIGVPRFLTAMVAFAFVIYLLPGMFGAPLAALSGYLPPQTTHDFDLVSLIRQNAGVAAVNNSNVPQNVKYGDKFKLPHGLKGYFDYKEALAAAKKENKPIFIDFTGHGCVNCRKMEANVWIKPEVLQRLQNDYIILALYVDDPTELPESEWVTSTYDGKVKKTIGKINADLQISRFNNNAQPYYVLLGHDELPLVTPVAYDENVDNFVRFLDAGKANFNAKMAKN
ncbi:protein-disulfide reductase DsbD family protein [Rhodoflexus caldus]|uniref:protein-disulfide reductase DsbD family protein n=1 Tax=Rhodoflexus caldus TaxID=2891236 RepID=UPI00202A4016|nr:cytochrome c biogenesis protein CcdA [Rhodoflexus caldus]